MAEAEWLNLGDLHLEKLDGLFQEKGLKYQFKALNDFFDYAESKGIRRAVQLGDIYETPHPTQGTQARYAEEVDRRRKKIIYDEIRGNHDWEDDENNSLKVFDTYLKLGALPNVRFHPSPIRTDIDGIPVCFLSFPYHEVPKGGPCVVFSHLEYSGALRDNGLKIKPKEGFAVPEDGNEYIVGHLHTYQRLGKHLIYPGTMLQLNFGERLPKGFVHTRASFRKGKLKLHNEFIPYTPPFELRNITITSRADLKQVKPSSRIFYKLFLADTVDIPETWLVDHPNVLRQNGLNTKGSKEDQVVAIADNETASPKANLDPWLKKYGLNKKQIKYANKFVDNIIREAGSALMELESETDV